jgi:hypothetical protein
VGRGVAVYTHLRIVTSWHWRVVELSTRAEMKLSWRYVVICLGYKLMKLLSPLPLKCKYSPQHFGTLSLTRGWVCRLQLLLALASAVILGSESHGTRDHILLSQIRDFPFRRPLRLAGLRWRYSTPPSHWPGKLFPFYYGPRAVYSSLL